MTSGAEFSDTDPSVRRLMDERWRTMSPAEKAAIACELTQACTMLAEAGIRNAHPNASARKIRYHLAARRYGAELAREVYGQASVL